MRPLLLCLCLPVLAFGQRGHISPSLTLSADSVSIGEIISVEVSVHHPTEAVIEFPSSRDFSPFELVRSTATPTQTEQSVSQDVITYEIRTFSMAAKQSLDLPLLWYNGQDTGQIRLLSDTLFLRRRIETVHDSLNYRFTINPIYLQDPPNYFPSLLLGFFVLLGASLIVFLLRKPARRYWALRNLNRNVERTKKALERLSGEQHQQIQLESLNMLWRSFLDPKMDLQLGAMTTTELIAGVQRLPFLTIEDHKALLKAATLRDEVSFAGNTVAKATIQDTIQALQRVVDRVYRHRKALIQETM